MQTPCPYLQMQDSTAEATHPSCILRSCSYSPASFHHSSALSGSTSSTSHHSMNDQVRAFALLQLGNFRTLALSWCSRLNISPAGSLSRSQSTYQDLKEDQWSTTRLVVRDREITLFLIKIRKPGGRVLCALPAVTNSCRNSGAGGIKKIGRRSH